MTDKTPIPRRVKEDGMSMRKMKKVCSKCGMEKLLSEFPKRMRGKRGCAAECKMCMNERINEWRKIHPEKVQAYGRKQYEKKRDAILNRTSTWAANNADKVKKYKSGWYSRNKTTQNQPSNDLTDDYLRKYLRRMGYPDDFINNVELLNLKRAELILKREIRKLERL